MITRVCCLLTASILMSGCASSSEDIKPAYISSTMYSTYDCKQLSDEAERLSELASERSGIQDRKRSSDVAATTAAAIIFWPAAFFIHGDDANATALSRLKGRMDAVEDESTRKKCNIQFHRPS